jgi:hypothetical protein
MLNLTLRSTELSRQLGFLRFSTIDASRAFVERNLPCIYLYGPSAGTHDRSTKVRIAYSREREDRTRPKGAGDWNCRKVSCRGESCLGENYFPEPALTYLVFHHQLLYTSPLL